MPEPVKSNEHKRVFIALWPDEITRQQLYAQQRKLKHELALRSARAVVPENLHMTLHFIGSVSMDVMQSLVTELDSVRCKSFNLEVNTVGHFPRPQVLWLGLTQIPAVLQELEQKTAVCVQQCVEGYQHNPYRPHITLYRKAKEPGEMSQCPVIHWPVKSFVLVESRTLSEGVRYEVLKEWSLLS